MFQTVVQRVNTIRLGSAMVEVGPDLDNLENLGFASNIEFSEEFSLIVFKPYNAPEIVVGIEDHYATVKFDLLEINMLNLQMLRGGIDNLTLTPGAVHNVVRESHVLTGTTPVRLNYRNSYDTKVNVKRVTDALVTLSSSDLFLLTSSDPYQLCAPKKVFEENIDYEITLDHAGYTCISGIANSPSLVDGTEVFVTYEYDIESNYLLTSGGLYTPSSRAMRLTNLDDAGHRFRLTIYNAIIQNGLDFKFPTDYDDSKTLVAPIEFKATPDLVRLAGDQLYSIYDEQGA